MTAWYEIEIAFSRFAPPTRRRPPGSSIARYATCWSTSPATRTARNSASTSFTHRILSSGRRGLLELRAFEMPPNARMSVAHSCCCALLIARFWREPLRGPADALGHGAPRFDSCSRTSSRSTSTM